MVNDLAEQVDECLLNQGRYCFEYNWDHENCLLYGVAGYPLFRGCLSIDVIGRRVGTFRIVISWMSALRGVREAGFHCKFIIRNYIITDLNSYLKELQS